ncbi:MAG TPA: hypothetical protein DCZ03_02960 [Gammaproteobacteria bacterium]|nr:hypothetical protein [Gammaproteobacteria bacterium]
MSYKLDWKDKGLVCEFNREFSNENLLESNAEIINDPRLLSLEYAIYDFSDVKEYPVETSIFQQIGQAAAESYKQNSIIKLAIVSNTTVMKGIMNVYKTYFQLANNNETWEMKMFRTRKEAEKWVLNSQLK